MPSIKNFIILAVTATTLFTGLHAQYTINPNNVPLATRNSWCKSQITTCPLLCLQDNKDGSSTTSANDCNPTTLTYNCVCSNGITPNVSKYPLTLPYFICIEYGNECADACNGNFICQIACRTEHPCGTQNQDPTSANTGSGSSKPSRSTKGTAIAIGAGIGVPVCLISVAAVGFHFYRHSKKSREEALKKLEMEIALEFTGTEKLQVIRELDDMQREEVYELGN